LTNCINVRAVIGKRCKYEKEFISLIQETFNRSGRFDVPDLFPSLNFLGILIGTNPALLKMHRKTNNILNDIINEHKKKRSATLARKCEESNHDDMIDVLL